MISHEELKETIEEEDEIVLEDQGVEVEDNVIEEEVEEEVKFDL